MASTKVEDTGSALDTIKIAGSILLLVVGIFGFYYFSEESTLYRVLGLLVLAGLAIGLFVTTAKGQGLWSFLRESRVEVRKMVWPTRGEALQTTGIVMVIVFIMGLFLWLLDMFLGWAVRFVIGGA